MCSPKVFVFMTNKASPSDTIITLKVGDPTSNTEALHVHRGVLCKNSEFFQKALQPEWTKSREHPDVIDLPQDTVQAVSDYIRWLYSGRIPVQLRKAGEGTETAEEAESVYVLIAEAYVFGEKILDAKYKNTMMKTVLAAKDLYGWNLGPDSVDIIYKGTPSTSLFRRLIANGVAREAFDDTKWMEFLDGYPREALVDAIKVTVRARPKPKLDTKSIESYIEEEK